MRDLLGMLGGRGWDCRVFCGSRLDSGRTVSPEELLAQGVGITARVEGCADAAPLRVLHGQQDRVRLTIFDSQDAQMPPGLAMGRVFLQLLDRYLERNRPDVLLTYGGHWIGRSIIALARGRGIRTVFWLRNCEYANAALFALVDGIIVPCEFSREYYRRSLGLSCAAIPSPVNWERVTCSEREPKYVTFVTPRPEKGLYFFAGIVRELARTRREVLVLVVQGRGSASWRKDAGLEEISNIAVMSCAADPRAFLSQTRVLLMPSLWQETFARLPIEAAVNGIPVLASRRGGLPESVADPGLVLEIPARYSPGSRSIPAEGEIRPWVELILRLWDDEEFYRTCSARAREGAEKFKPEMIAERHEAFLEKVLRAGGGPLRGGSLDDVLRGLERYLPPGQPRLDTDELDRLLGAGLG